MEDKKYKYTYNGNEIKFGEYLSALTPLRTPFGRMEVVCKYLIESVEDIESLINRGVDIHKTELQQTKEDKRPTRLGDLITKRMSEIPTDIEHYVGKDLKYGYGFLLTKYPLELYNILAKRIAIELDKSYLNNIRNCDYLLVIDTVTGKPFMVEQLDYNEKEWIDLLNNNAAFRSEVDVIVCQKILSKLKKIVWSGKIKRNE